MGFRQISVAALTDGRDGYGFGWTDAEGEMHLTDASVHLLCGRFRTLFPHILGFCSPLCSVLFSDL